MGIPERKSRERLERREFILDAATRVLTETGVDATTMDMIAREAELSKGTLYLYFKNKSELMLGIYERITSELNSRFARILQERRSGMHLIRHMGASYLDFVMSDPLNFAVIQFFENMRSSDVTEQTDLTARSEATSREAFGYIVQALQTGMKDGSIDDRYDPESLAIMIWSSSRGILQAAHMQSTDHPYQVFGASGFDVQMMFQSFMDLMGKGLEPSPALVRKSTLKKL